MIKKMRMIYELKYINYKKACRGVHSYKDQYNYRQKGMNLFIKADITTLTFRSRPVFMPMQ